MGPNAATIGAPAPKIMQDVVPPYAKALHGGIAVSNDVADPTPAAIPTPEPPTPETPPVPQVPPMPQPGPPSPSPTPEQPPVTFPSVPVVQERTELSQPMFPQAQAVEDSQAAPTPLAFTPKPLVEGQAVAHNHHAKVSTNWLVISLAVIVAIVLAAVAVMAMRG